jgi:hypothetical protein
LGFPLRVVIEKFGALSSSWLIRAENASAQSVRAHQRFSSIRGYSWRRVQGKRRLAII